MRRLLDEVKDLVRQCGIGEREGLWVGSRHGEVIEGVLLCCRLLTVLKKEREGQQSYGYLTVAAAA